MPPLDLYRRYVDQRRALAPRGFSLESPPGRTRLSPLQPDLAGMVMFTALSADEIETAVIDEVAYFARLQRGFEWKVYDFDTPTDLAARLAGNTPADAARRAHRVAAAVIQVRGALAPFETLRAAFAA